MTLIFAFKNTSNSSLRISDNVFRSFLTLPDPALLRASSFLLYPALHTFVSLQGQFVVSKYPWMCGLPLESSSLIRALFLEKTDRITFRREELLIAP